MARGRPPLPESERLLCRVTISLKQDDFDDACESARAKAEPVAVVLRDLVTRRLHVDSKEILP